MHVYIDIKYGYRLQDAIYEICNCDNVEYRKNNNLYAIMK